MDEMSSESSSKSRAKSSKSSSSSEESQQDARDSEDLIQQRKKFLKDDIEQNPHNFKSYIDMIRILRQSGELDEVRNLREKVSQLFPLHEVHWLEWILDEQRIAANDKEIQSVVSLYERAVADYITVDLWLQWTEWEEILAEDKGNYESVKQRYEQGITQAGLHVAKGHEIWDAYINFEKRVLEKMEDKFPQQEKIRKLYQRSLSIPLSNMNDRMAEYNSWEESLADNGHKCAFTDQYNAALKLFEDRRPFEEKISESDPNSPDYSQLDNWWEYIHFEEQQNDISRVRCLYERAVRNYCLVYDFWNSYIKYLQHNMKNVPKVILSVTSRAVRNYPYTHHFWCIYLQELERAKRSSSEISKVFEDGLASGFNSEDDYGELFNCYIDSKARALRQAQDSTEEEKAKLIQDLRTACSRSVDYFTQYFPTSTILEKLTRHWALIEADIIKDVSAAQRLFETLFKTHSKHPEFWFDAVAVLKTFGQHSQCRNLFKRASNVVSTDPHTIWSEWVAFERLFGSLDDLELANERISAKRLEIAAQQEAAAEEMKKSNPPSNKKRRPHDKYEDITLGSRKRKKQLAEGDESFENDTVPKEKGRPSTKGESFYDKRIIHISNLPENVTDVKLKEIFEKFGPIVEVRCIHDSSGAFKGFAYIEFENESGASQAIAGGATDTEDAQTTGGIKYDDNLLKVAPARALRPGTVVPPATVKPISKRHYSDQLTLFVTNLAYCTTEEELSASFTELNPSISVKEVRIVRNRNSGRSRGFAYVEFGDKESLNQALNNDGKILHHFAMKLAISKPPTKAQSKQSEMDIDTRNDAEQEKGDEKEGDKGVEISNKSSVFAVPAKPKRLMPRAVKKPLQQKSKVPSDVSNNK